jgi:4'-phosphopantetheinyl transferase
VSGERTGTGMPMTEQKCRVFTWSLDVPENDAASLMSLLSSDEHLRARRLVKKEDALHFVAARAGLRMILGEEIGKSPRDLTFQLSPSGKPRLANHGDMHFNLSHSSGHAVLALSRQEPVGIDIERIRELASGIEFQFLSSEEISRLVRFSASARMALLVGWWAAKEAVIKLYGDYRQLKPGDIDLSLDDAGRSTSARVAGEAGCTLTSLEATPGFACMLAQVQPLDARELVVARWQGLRAHQA